MIFFAANQLVSMWGKIGLGTGSQEASSVASTCEVSPPLLSIQGGNICEYLDFVGFYDHHEEIGDLFEVDNINNHNLSILRLQISASFSSNSWV